MAQVLFQERQHAKLKVRAVLKLKFPNASTDSILAQSTTFEEGIYVKNEGKVEGYMKDMNEWLTFSKLYTQPMIKPSA